MDSSKTSGRIEDSRATIHGFRVQSYGKPLSPGFKRALKRLSERGFDEPTCVVVKMSSGSPGGITHAGGRYVHPHNPQSREVIREMQARGMGPPRPPFVLTPGEFTLYHEWGHHVDRTWSRSDQEVLFSFRWFSRFYGVGIQESSQGAQAGNDCGEEIRRPWRIDSERHAVDAILLWWRASSELFANLFEDWMRVENKVAWDHCEPESLNTPDPGGHRELRITLLPGVRPEDVRGETYALFEGGIRSAMVPPLVRGDLFGVHTEEVIARFRDAMKSLGVGS